jgi:hypothetical protein
MYYQSIILLAYAFDIPLILMGNTAESSTIRLLLYLVWGAS